MIHGESVECCLVDVMIGIAFHVAGDESRTINFTVDSYINECLLDVTNVQRIIADVKAAYNESLLLLPFLSESVEFYFVGFKGGDDCIFNFSIDWIYFWCVVGV